ncbi:unnamed protein product [Lactuca virosa]|uniref:RRM domain-containing protein n=1 Tax=Lactuca virosa TaxID=75947 RepID=A0AAU9LUC7_9ASTR|nr:unnamed protein product [Lactuca virosa]
MATISSAMISSTSYLHHHPTSKSFKTQLPNSFKLNPNLSQPLLRFTISPIVSNPRQPTRLLSVAEETPVAVVTVDPSSEAARRLYVGNIPRTTNNDELQKVFEDMVPLRKLR